MIIQRGNKSFDGKWLEDEKRCFVWSLFYYFKIIVRYLLPAFVRMISDIRKFFCLQITTSSMTNTLVRIYPNLKHPLRTAEICPKITSFNSYVFISCVCVFKLLSILHLFVFLCLFTFQLMFTIKLHSSIFKDLLSFIVVCYV